ncbi:hypothetical protein JL721_7914 [Aureococcus anophagefferens]|nr:hypothetical protein JL721_7914 [Aureococcus anophagefferens]
MECKAVAARRRRAGRRRAADAFLSADVLGKPIGDVDDSRRRAGRCRAATNAVLCASLAERAEVPVGADEAEVWAWLDPLRPYAPYEAMGWEDWLDQLTPPPRSSPSRRTTAPSACRRRSSRPSTRSSRTRRRCGAA